MPDWTCYNSERRRVERLDAVFPNLMSTEVVRYIREMLHNHWGAINDSIFRNSLVLGFHKYILKQHILDCSEKQTDKNQTKSPKQNKKQPHSLNSMTVLILNNLNVESGLIRIIR